MLVDKLDENVKAVMELLENKLKDTDHYWTTNYSSLFKLSGTKITPNQRGMNNLKDKKVCVFMAAMNPHPNSAQYLNELFNFTIEYMVQDYETETLYQFVYRSVVRNYDSKERVTVYVYDSEQAYSIPSGTVEKIELGLKSTKSIGGRPSLVNAPKEIKNRFASWKSKNNNKANSMIKYQKWEVKQRKNEEYKEVGFSQFEKQISIEYIRKQL